MTKLPRDAEHDEESLFAQWQPAAAGCPPPDLLFPAAEGALPAEVAGPILAHVETCPLCRELSTVDAGDAASPTLQEGARLRARTFSHVTAPARRPRRWSSYAITYAAAAAVVLAAATVALVRLIN